MIRRIERIKNFGVFSDFSWPLDLHEFKKFNLIFGWNYAGKTTFSRTFRCFEQMALHPDFMQAEVQLRLQDGAIHRLTTLSAPHSVRVFNVDFVRENILFDTGTAQPILVLGAEDIAKQAELKAKQQELQVMEAAYHSGLTTKDRLQANLDKALTSEARRFKNSFGRPVYDRRHFEVKVDKCLKESAKKYLLDDQAQRENHHLYRSTDKRDSLTPGLGGELTSPGILLNLIAPLMAHRVSAGRPLARLVQDPDLANWVDVGRRLHEDRSDCQFCGQPLPTGLLSDITAHFSADYDNLINTLEQIEAQVEEARAEAISLPAKSDFYPELQDEVAAISVSLRKLLKDRTKSLETLLSLIARKKTKAFSALQVPEVEDNSAEILQQVKRLEGIIKRHNLRAASFEQTRIDALAKLEMDYAARFVKESGYAESLSQIASLQSALTDTEKKLARLRQATSRLERELSDAARGAETLNVLIGAYFGKDDIRIGVSSENRFNIVRNGTIAKNLSEGERSAIAFAYFMARLEDGKRPLSEITVVVDDPMCSLDAHHLFNTYAFVKTRLAGCFQLFLLTHSYEFYSLLKEWAGEIEKFDKPQSLWKEWSIYLLRRTDNGCSSIEVIPPQLLSFKSEYHYLFSTLFRFNASTENTFDYLFSLPNVIRRFMEAFGGVMIPTHAGLSKKLPRLIPDPVARERVWRFINHYSHNTSQARSLVIPDISECRMVVSTCLSAVEVWNPQYYADLVSAIS